MSIQEREPRLDTVGLARLHFYQEITAMHVENQLMDDQSGWFLARKLVHLAMDQGFLPLDTPGTLEPADMLLRTDLEAPSDFIIAFQALRGITLHARGAKKTERMLENGWYTTDRQQHSHARWQQSGLELAERAEYAYFGTAAAVTHKSVIEAFDTGGINIILPDPDERAVLRSYYASCFGIHLGEDVTTFPLPESLAELPFEDYEPLPDYRQFLHACMSETRKQPYTGRHINGPRFDEISQRVAEIDKLLKAIDPGLKPEHLHAKSYRRKTLAPPDLDDLAARRKYEQLYERKNARLHDLGDLHLPTELLVSIKPGVDIDVPPYIRQQDPTMCASACFRMTLAGLANIKVDEYEFTMATEGAFLNRYVHHEQFLKIYQSEEFRKITGVQAQTVQFVGMSLEAIAKIAKGLKAKDPEYTVYCVLNTETETAPDKNIWHNIVLLGSEGNTVTFHDPTSNQTYGGAKRPDNKAAFLRRWAAAYNSGYFVISNNAKK